MSKSGISMQHHVGRAIRKNKHKCRIIPINSIDRVNEALITLGRAGQRGSAAGAKFALCLLLVTVKINLARAINYQLPKSTITDHLKDCFSWLMEVKL